VCALLVTQLNAERLQSACVCLQESADAVAQELGLLLSMVRLGMDEQQQAAAEALQQAGAVLLPAFGAAAEGGQQQQQEVRLHAAHWAVEGAKYLTTDTRWQGGAAMLCLAVSLVLVQQEGGRAAPCRALSRQPV
jgi:hypothetical protein